ncbi:Imm49 family immunity protein [Nocardia australiensis]|uniref:Imm49 family immunity protein n=1 Tax=Nocardia australiensis TaxID=2887191 RepID=UPI001D13A133|nr:Imm49 family immunity protein [Nocardia australiensis]
MQHDTEQFTTALVQALEQHREYWTTNDRPGDPDGFIALAPLANRSKAVAFGSLAMREDNRSVASRFDYWKVTP